MSRRLGFVLGLLKDLEQRAFRHFWDMTDPTSGLTRGGTRADGTLYDANRRDIGSIAVTGFGLTALCIGAEKGWVKRGGARTRAERYALSPGACSAGARLVLPLDERHHRGADWRGPKQRHWLQRN